MLVRQGLQPPRELEDLQVAAEIRKFSHVDKNIPWRDFLGKPCPGIRDADNPNSPRHGLLVEVGVRVPRNESRSGIRAGGFHGELSRRLPGHDAPPHRVQNSVWCFITEG